MIVSAPQKAATKVPLMNVSVSLSNSSLKHAYHEDGAPAGGEVGVGLRREDAEHVVVLQPVSIAFPPNRVLFIFSPRAPARRSSSSLAGPTTFHADL